MLCILSFKRIKENETLKTMEIVNKDKIKKQEKREGKKRRNESESNRKNRKENERTRMK